MTSHPQKLQDLLQLLVCEFRIWQALLCLMHTERCLLVECDVTGLTELAPRKDELLKLLSNYHKQRRWIAPDSDEPFGIDPICGEGRPALAGLADDEAARLSRIFEGIRTLAWQVGELAEGNYALADCSTRRLWSIQTSRVLWAQGEPRKKLPVLLSELLVRPEPFGQIEGGEFLGGPLNVLAVEEL